MRGLGAGLGWAGGREAFIARGACSFLKGTVVMEDMVISKVGLLAGGFGSVRLGLVWLGILKHGIVPTLGTRYLRHPPNLRIQR